MTRLLYQSKGKFILSNSSEPEIAYTGTFDVSAHSVKSGPTTRTRTTTGTPVKIVLPGVEVYHRSGQTVEIVEDGAVVDTAKVVGFQDWDIDFSAIYAAMAQ